MPAAEVPTQADVERAARLANIHHVIQAMPNGYDSVWYSFIGSRQSACAAGLCQSALH